MRLPQTTKSRVWLAVGVVTVAAIVAFGMAAYSLWQDGNVPSTSSSKESKHAIPPGPTGYPTFSGPSTAVPGGVSKIPGLSASEAALLASGKGISTDKPFASGFGDTRLHKVTVSVTGDGALNIGYRFRDGKDADSRVVTRSFSYTRSVHGPLPVVQIGVQVLYNATYATCSITIDGTTTVTRRSATGPGHIAVCTS